MRVTLCRAEPFVPPVKTGRGMKAAAADGDVDIVSKYSRDSGSSLFAEEEESRFKENKWRNWKSVNMNMNVSVIYKHLVN